jgi:hypothetical protein
LKYKEIFIEVDEKPLGCTAATITEDASDLLSVELSMFWYKKGLSTISILREVTPVND